MSRTPLPSPAPGRWAGLRLEVNGPSRPGLRVEVTSGRRLLLRQGDQAALFGVQRTARRGVHYIRTNRFRSPLPPMEAGLARRLRQAGGDDQALPSDAALARRLGKADSDEKIAPSRLVRGEGGCRVGGALDAPVR